MNEIFVMYLPTIVMVVGYITTFFNTMKALKGFSFKKDTTELCAKVDTMIKENKILRQENKELRQQLSLIIDKLYKVKDYEVVVVDGKGN